MRMIKQVRRSLAIWAAKLIGTVCRLAGKQGVTWAGQVAIIICPDILRELSEQVRGSIFVVCGTNGKTTTNNLLCEALKSEKKKVICNQTGSNMLNGVVSAFVLAADNKGNLDADYACIEIDEASAVKVFPYLKPDFMILTNLFRDQLDRYGEIDITMNLLKEAMQMVPDMAVVVNADDSLSTFLAMDSGNEYITYGIGQKVFDEDPDSKEIREGQFCKRCGTKMEYHFYHYSQLGDYYCPNCGFRRPALDFDATDVKVSGQLSFKVEGRRIQANYRGFYNIYNILAAYAGARSAGLVLKNFNQICETEKKIEEKINTLQNDKNIDFEIFSPRMEEKSIRAKMNDYYEELHKIQEKKEKVKKELDGASKEMEKFRIMAAELMNLDKQARANANNKHTMTKKK